MAKTFTARARIIVDDRGTPKVRAFAKSFAGLDSAVTSSLASFARFAGVAGGVGTILATIGRETLQNEAAFGRLEAALEGIGDSSQLTRDALADVAQELQRATGVGQSEIAQLQALAVAFTGSAEAAGDLTAAALDFATGAGLSFEEALRRLGRTLGGSVEDVSKFVPEVANLSREALRAGEAIQLVGDRFAGQAADAVETFAGRLKQLATEAQETAGSLGQLLVELTGIESEGGFLENSIREFQTLGDVVDELRTDFQSGGFFNLLPEIAQNFLSVERATAQANRELANSTAAWLEWRNGAQAAREEAERLAEETRLSEGLGQVDEILKSLGLTLDGTSIKLEDAALKLANFDRLVSEGFVDSTEAAAAAQSKLVQSLIEQEGGLQRLETLYREGSISIRAYEEGVRLAAAAQVDLTASTTAGTGALRDNKEAADDLSDAYQNLAASAAEAGEQIRGIVGNSREFDTVSREQGRAAAVEQALASGEAKLVLGGTRIRFNRGGSRLVTAPGLRNNL